MTKLKAKEDYLHQILHNESMSAKYGALAARLKREYCQKYAPYKKGEVVEVEGCVGATEHAKVKTVKFHHSRGFIFGLQPVLKNTNEPKRRRRILFVRANEDCPKIIGIVNTQNERS